MTVTLEEMLAEESEESRGRIRQHVQEFRAEIRLRELRRLRRLTQARLSKKLKIGQEGVSRIEKRTDLYLSTLRSYVEGVGGKLSLVVEFPDQAPVILAGLGMDEEKPRKSSRKKVAGEKPSKPAKAMAKVRSGAKGEPRSGAKSGTKMVQNGVNPLRAIGG